MKDGGISVEKLELSSLTRHQDLVEPGMGSAVFGGDPQSSWFNNEFLIPLTRACSERPAGRNGSKIHEPDRIETKACEAASKTAACPGQSAKQIVPTLRRKTLKVTARVPRLLPVKVTPEPKREEDLPVKTEPVIQKKPAPMPKHVLELPPLERPPVEFSLPEIPPHVRIQVIPTPRKREPRPVTLSEEQNTPPVAKPLKIIRKRRQEEPKIFETAPKPVPQAMLEGIKTTRDEGDDIE